MGLHFSIRSDLSTSDGDGRRWVAKYQFGEEDEKMEGKGLMVRYSGDGVPKTAMGDKNEPGSSYNLSSGWYLVLKLGNGRNSL